MNGLPKVQSIVAPLAAPIAPAVLLANEIYSVMIQLEIQHWIALGSSIVGIIGIDFSGALMCVGAVRAWRRRSWAIFAVAVSGAIVYATIVYAGIASMSNERGRVFGVMIFLTLVAYAGYAIFSLFEEETKIEVEATESEIEKLNAQRLLVNAETRQIKAGGAASNQVSNVKLDNLTPNRPRITAAGRRVIEYLDEYGENGSLREIGKSVGCSHQTVATWLEYWKNDNKN